jgi:hypothetical protein
MVMSLYPATQKNPKLAQNVVQLLDVGMGGSEGVAEGSLEEIDRRGFLKGMGAAAGLTTLGKASGQPRTYADQIVRRIKPNMVFMGDIDSNPRTEVEIRSAPDGTILSRRITQSSGNEEWDKAVLRAIDRSVSLPKDTDGRVPPIIVIGFSPNDNEPVRRPSSRSQLGVDDTTKKILFDSLMLLYFSQFYKKHQAWEKHKNEIVSFADTNMQQDYITTTYAKIKSDLDALRKSDPNKWNNFAKQVGDNSGSTIQAMKRLGLSITEVDQQGVAEGEEQNVFAPDIETQQLLRYAQQHYPNTQGKQQAFVKFVQRALNHSEEDDMEQDEKIEQLAKAIKQLDAKVSQVTESEDYLEEK